MAFGDAVQADLEDVFYDVDSFAESMTYSPATGADFTITAVFEDFTLNEQLDPHVVADSAKITVLHSDLVAGGITDPTIEAESTTGDEIVRIDHNGSNETWIVVGKNIEPFLQEWTLLISKRPRIIP